MPVTSALALPTKAKLSAMLLCDFYKVSHREMYPTGTECVYSTWTPRENRLEHVTGVVVFGAQAFIKTYLMEFFDENFFNRPKLVVIEEYSRIISSTLGVKNPSTKHIEDLHDLGYLPLEIKDLPEGTVVPFRVPTLTIRNTHPDFFWLTNYIETLASAEMWQASTSATIAHTYHTYLTRKAIETVGNDDFVQFQGHDFSMRGMSSLGSAISSGMGHLLSFAGTDTIPAIQGMEYLYNADVTKELVGTSIPASEHSIQCAYGNDYDYLHTLITKTHPDGFVSIVSDGYDFWDVIGAVVPLLKYEIMARDGRVVIRPDSGDPVKIIIGDPEGATEVERKGAVEALWDIFGGTETDKGYKLLDSHIGLIYGDAITYDRATQIIEGLQAKGFASINVVFGIGSYTYQYNTRDTLGYALKSTAVIINGNEIQIFKDPKTDNGTKKSQKGRVIVLPTEDGSFEFVDQLSLDTDYPQDYLRTVYRNGVLLIDEKFAVIKSRLRSA